MKINISFQKPFGTRYNDISQWIWMSKRYTACFGFIVRFFGIYINIRENNATDKIIKAIKTYNTK
jgi:hypothetical protein